MENTQENIRQATQEDAQERADERVAVREKAQQQEGETRMQGFDEMLKDNPLFQREFDRRTTKALKTAQEKWQKDTDARILEAERLAKMTVQERAEHEKHQREEELDARERALLTRERKAQAAQTLAQKGLPLALLEALNYADEESLASSLSQVENAFRNAVQAGIEGRLQGSAPLKGAKTSDTEQMTDEEYYTTIQQRRKKG